MPKRLKVAVQKSGRLSEDSLALLRACDLEFDNARGGAALKLEPRNFPVEILLLRDDDIPRYVSEGVADVGIVGENVLLETGLELTVLERLGFGQCRLSVAVPKDSSVEKVSDLRGQRIATSYPRMLQQYLAKEGVTASVHEISGSVEIAPGIGLAAAIFDIVSSGSTLALNGLRELAVAYRSQAVVLTRQGLGAEEKELLEKLRFRIQAVERARRNKYILLNAPNESLEEIIQILPGLKSPTVLPLAEPGWSSVHSVIEEDEFWDVLQKLRDAGAQGILVCAVEKMIG